MLFLFNFLFYCIQFYMQCLNFFNVSSDIQNDVFLRFQRVDVIRHGFYFIIDYHFFVVQFVCAGILYINDADIFGNLFNVAFMLENCRQQGALACLIAAFSG